MIRIYPKEKCVKIEKLIFSSNYLDIDLIEYLPDEIFGAEFSMHAIEFDFNSYCYTVNETWKVPYYFVR